MSVQENKAVAERLLEAWNDGDFDAIQGMVAPDFVNHNPPPFPGAGADRDGMLTAMRALRSAFPDARAEILNVVAEGDKVVLHDAVRATHEGDFLGVAASGREVRFEFIHIFRVAGGRIVERWGLVDAMSLMQQLGAIPAPEAAQAR